MKRFIKIAIIIGITAVLSISIYMYYKHINSIDYILKTSNYNYLPAEAQKYIKEYYEKTGEILLTEKNKEDGVKYLNPEYARYLQNEDNYEAIPNDTIIDAIYTTSSIDNLEDTYDLRNVIVDGNTHNYVTPQKNQKSWGLCWDFSAIGALESSAIVHGVSDENNPIIFSESQVDFALSYGSGTNYLGYNYTLNSQKSNPNGMRSLGSGGNSNYVFYNFLNGISPVVVNENTYWKSGLQEVSTIGSYDYNLSLDTILGYDNVNYFVPGITTFASTYFSSEEAKEEYIKEMKAYIKENGAVTVGSASPQSSCYVDSNGKHSYGKSDVIYNIYHKDTYEPDCDIDHEMVVIGWDDNKTYCTAGAYETEEECINAKGTFSKGAWILKNSWGSSYSNPYLMYDSYYYFGGGISEITTRNWSNVNKRVSTTIENKNYETISRNNANEKLTDLVFDIYSIANGNIKFYIKDGEYSSNIEDYTYIGNYDATNNKFKTITYSQSIHFTLDNFNLSSDKYTIYYESDSDDMAFAYIYSYSNIDKLSSTKDIDVSLDKDKYNIRRDDVILSGETKGYANNTELNIKIFDPNGNEVNTFGNLKTTVYNNKINTTINFPDELRFGDYEEYYILKLYYNDEEISNLGIFIEELNTYSIKTASDFCNIISDPYGIYNIENDIDMATYNNCLNNYSFYGELNGNNYTLYNLNTKYNIFDGLDHASIHDINFKDVTYESSSSDSISFLAFHSVYTKINNLTLENFTGKNSNSSVYYFSVFGYGCNNIYENINVLNADVNSLGKGYIFDQGINTSYNNINFTGKIHSKKDSSIFGTLIDSNIKNITSNIIVESETGSASVIDSLNNSTAENIFNKGNLTGLDYTALISVLNSSTISKIYNYGTISGRVDVAGIAALGYLSELDQIANYGNVIGNTTVGGLIGEIRYYYTEKSPTVNITKAFNAGTISGSDRIGGLVGYYANAQINDAFNTGDVYATNTTYSGGFFGDYQYSIEIDNQKYYAKATNLYNVGKLYVNDTESYNVINGYYYYMDNYNNYYFLGDTSDGNHQLTLDQMKSKTNYNGFDFDNVWTIENDGALPTLRDLPYYYVTDITSKDIKLGINAEANIYDYLTISPSNATNKTLEFASSDESKLTISENGDIKALANGVVSITVKTTDGSHIEKTFLINADENNTATVTFDANDNSGNTSSQKVQIGTATKLNKNEFSRKNYIFTGWNTKVDGSGTAYTDEEEVTISSDITLYAMWIKSKYTITFKDNGGICDDVTQIVNYNEETKLNANIFTKDGYQFSGWGTDKDNNTITYLDAGIIKLTSDITLYAKWTPNAYLIEFDAGGGDGYMDSIEATYDKSLTLPVNTFTKIGYLFKNWSYNDSSYVDEDQVKNLTSKNQDIVTLKANWTPIKYTITFDANGAEGSMDNINAEYDSTLTIPENTYTYSGKVFTGWLVVDYPEEYILYPGSEINNLADINGSVVTLKAIWEDDYIYKLSNYTESNDMILEIAPDTLTSDYIKNFDLNTGYSISVEHTDKGYVYTGSITRITDANSNVIKEWKNVILGDTNGDGIINYLDYVKIYNHIQKVKNPTSSKKMLENEYFVAGDMNQNNTLNYLDYVKVYNKIKELKGDK